VRAAGIVGTVEGAAVDRLVARGSLLAWFVAVTTGGAACGGEPYVAGSVFTLNDNGAWSWFMDERAVVHDGHLVVGSVRSVGEFNASKIDADWGNVEVATYALATKQVGTRILFRRFEQDDHDNPTFLPLKDGGLLAVFTKHRQNQNIYVQRSRPGDPLKWSAPDVVQSPKSRTGDDYATYSNLFRLPSGAIVNFYRGYHQDPNFMISDDEGVTWRYGGRLMQGQDGYSPYLKYTQDRDGAIHFVATEDHPATFANSLYHGVLAGDELRLSDGQVLVTLSADTSVAARTWEFTRVYQGDADNVAWMTDIEVDAEGRPVIAFSVQKDRDPHDIRYGYARWDGQRWHARQVAHAGERLYENEADYSGLATLDPQDTRVLYISTNADPVVGSALISATDGLRHYELFRGVTEDGGETFDWEPITRDSWTDNLRPLVPRWDDERTALVWMRGEYTHNRGQWTSAVVGVILD
jgi:hypothetical protein